MVGPRRPPDTRHEMGQCLRAGCFKRIVLVDPNDGSLPYFIDHDCPGRPYTIKKGWWTS